MFHANQMCHFRLFFVCCCTYVPGQEKVENCQCFVCLAQVSSMWPWLGCWFWAYCFVINQAVYPWSLISQNFSQNCYYFCIVILYRYMIKVFRKIVWLDMFHKSSFMTHILVFVCLCRSSFATCWWFGSRFGIFNDCLVITYRSVANICENL